jgi:hypothetical protein
VYTTTAEESWRQQQTITIYIWFGSMPDVYGNNDSAGQKQTRANGSQKLNPQRNG